MQRATDGRPAEVTTALPSQNLAPNFKDDIHRPQYHFLPPANWLNDPNGVIQWQDEYHLFYQYNPNGAFHGTIHWGHAVSRDLVHWQHLPIALTPGPDSADADGCWSGYAVNNNGVPTLIYTGVREGKTYQRPCLATSDDNLVTWQKYPGNPIITAPPESLGVTGFRDHCVWREGELWYQIIGVGFENGGGAALLYSSPDLINWQYHHTLYDGDYDLQPEVWECPDFFALDDRHVLLISSWARKQTLYYTGQYRDHKFWPTYQAELDAGACLYAPQTFQDTQGRRILWGWLREGRSNAAQRAAGWSGVMSLPLLISPHSDGKIALNFAPEVKKLRGELYQLQNQLIKPTPFQLLEGVAGQRLEIEVMLELEGAEEFGLWLCCAPDNSEQTAIRYNCQTQLLEIDTTQSSLDLDSNRERQGGVLPLDTDKTLKLHIYLDHSVIEIVANDHFYLSGRIYPTRTDSNHLGLSAQGGAVNLKSLNIWQLGSIWT